MKGLLSIPILALSLVLPTAPQDGDSLSGAAGNCGNTTTLDCSSTVGGMCTDFSTWTSPPAGLPKPYRKAGAIACENLNGTPGNPNATCQGAGVQAINNNCNNGG